nr:pirin-like C-terminal cupin domain-containing protein [uncultured Lichenicoccus sp.]
MTAGRGLTHAKLFPDSFLRAGGSLEILQLWVNLPARLKLTEPRYVGLQGPNIPQFELDAGRVRVALTAGKAFEREGAIPTLVDITMMTVGLDEHHLAEVDDSRGDDVGLTAELPTVLLLGHAEPFGEPIVSHGPLVMKTQGEIRQAIRDYQASLFA